MALTAAFGLVSGVASAIGTAWHFGRRSAKKEADAREEGRAIKDDYDGKVAKLREEVRKEMAAHAEKVEAGNNLLVTQFTETLNGLRRQQDEMRVYIEKRFLPKDDFRDWLKEYREDQRRTDTKLDRLLGMKQ